MKILIISTVSFELNGITSVIMNYYRNMNKLDMKIDFIVPNEISNNLRLELEKNRSKVFCVERKRNPVSYKIRLMNILMNNKYDIAHVHGNSSTMALEAHTLKKAKVAVRIVHSHNTACIHTFIDKLCTPFFKNSYTHGFACGEQAGNWLFKGRKFQLVRNGIDLDKYCFNNDVRIAVRKKINAGDRTVIGHIGNFLYQKNHAFLIYSFAKLLQINPQYLLLLIGSGELMGQMKTRVKSLGISDSVIFTGETSEAQNYLQAMDIFVLPSHYEGFPVSLVEAQASGLHCIAGDNVPHETDLTRLVDFIPNGTDIWVEEIEKIAAKILCEDRESLSAAACKELDKKGYNITSAAERVREIYQTYFTESCFSEKQ